MTNTIIWSRNGCPYCDMAKDLLNGSGIEFQERNIQTDDWTKEQLLEAVPGAKTVPQIFLRGEYIGGYQELRKYYEDHDMFTGSQSLG